MSSTLLQTSGESEAPTAPRAGTWENRHPVAAALIFLVFLALVGWLTFTSAKAENHRRATYPAIEVR